MVCNYPTKKIVSYQHHVKVVTNTPRVNSNISEAVQVSRQRASLQSPVDLKLVWMSLRAYDEAGIPGLPGL